MSLPWTSAWTLLLVLLPVPLVIAFCLPKKRIRKPAPKAWVPFEGDPLSSASEILSGFWARSEDSPAPYADAESAVLGLEQRYGVILPVDFRTYLLTVAPAEDHWDKADATWWSPSRIRNIVEELEKGTGNPAIASKAGSCLLFADYMFWCWGWAICCEQGPITEGSRSSLDRIAGLRTASPISYRPTLPTPCRFAERKARGFPLGNR